MKRSRFVLLLVAAVAGLLGSHAGLGATVGTIPDAQISGTVIGYDTQSALLNVETRLGPKSFLVNNTTLILLNNHSATTTNIQPNDQVTVTYDYTTFTAIKVHLFREVKVSGTIRSVGTNSIVVHLNGGGASTLTTNASSVIRLDEIPISTTSVLAGRPVDAVFEPTSNLLLSLNAHSPDVNGRITAINTTNDTVTVKGVTYTVVSSATIRRAGTTATLSTLMVGDRAHLAWVHNGASRNALAIDAQP